MAVGLWGGELAERRTKRGAVVLPRAVWTTAPRLNWGLGKVLTLQPWCCDRALVCRPGQCGWDWPGENEVLWEQRGAFTPETGTLGGVDSGVRREAGTWEPGDDPVVGASPGPPGGQARPLPCGHAPWASGLQTLDTGRSCLCEPRVWGSLLRWLWETKTTASHPAFLSLTYPYL